MTELRSASHIMRLATMGSSFPTRLSFLRRLIRALNREEAQVTRQVWQIDDQGYGHAVYSVPVGGHTYSLVAFTRDLPPEMRTDRVIATAWDAAFVLYDGIPDTAEIARIGANAPLQEAGRFTEKDLVLSRANKSVRLFKEVSEALRAGHQPAPDRIREIGYLMRTTAVYGNGKFGMADRALYADRPVMDGPFAAEMLTVWLIRGFTLDLIEHLGGMPLDRSFKRHLGIGNSTGLGMAPFLVSHPNLLHAWVTARETALAEVLANGPADAPTEARIDELAERVSRHLNEWIVPDQDYQRRIAALRAEWPAIRAMLADWDGDYTALLAHNPTDPAITDELRELIVALILEANPSLVDAFSDCMATDAVPVLDPTMNCATLRAGIADRMGWALAPDFENADDTHQFWYVSEAKLEPRLGLRHQEDGAELESPLDIARRVQALYDDLQAASGNLAQFLIAHPEHRHAARRAQCAMSHAYSEINDNLIGRICLPIDMLRFKLAMFGASKFDPKSDRWTRITLAQGAPLFDEITSADADDWWLPVFGS